ncbi:hypothetical protein [Plantactinospora sp. CA-290183]|uniref:hypothetical protein n=1 Tax=Plantactinospora sp. CA-290183 TaxID=3240006 RepID=UPI003D8DC2EC
MTQPAFRPQPGASQPGAAQPGWQWQPGPQSPSGLFPAAPPSPHPTYREPHPARPAGALAGGTSAAIWLLAFGFLGSDLRGYLLWTIVAGAVAWLVALALTWFGDRGVAVGIAVVSAFGWAVAAAALAVRWFSTGDWPLW